MNDAPQHGRTILSGRSDDFRSAESAIDRHVARAILKLGKVLARRRAIYLDTNYWIKLRDANRDKGTATTCYLLSILRKGVAEGVVFCPISEAVFLELMKQGDPASRLATASLIDELSLGATLALETERITTEIQYFMYWASGRSNPHPIEHWIWRKLGYVLGLVHPNPATRDLASKLVFQGTFFDHMWTISLRDMVTAMDDGKGSEPAISDGTAAINDGIVRHADKLCSFVQAYNDEAKGIVDLFGDAAVSAVTSLATHDGITLTQPNPEVRRETENFCKNALFFALKRNKARHVLRTLHIHASLHAALRWSKGRRLRSNDLDDFTHAAAALAYCNAFFTERSLRSTVTAGHVALDKLYHCYVATAEDDAIACASRLVR